jgi:hypothetical protein
MPHTEGVLWTMRKDTETIRALMRAVDGHFELQLLSGASGKLQVFCAAFRSVPAVRAAATSECEILKGRGWTLVDDIRPQ